VQGRGDPTSCTVTNLGQEHHDEPGLAGHRPANLSVWSKKLLVTGAMEGATIQVRSIGPNARAVAKGNSSGGWDWLDLLPGITLQDDDRLVANQHLGSDTSPWTPNPAAYPVNPVPTNAADLGAVTLQTYPWECGQYIWITGAEPGSSVQVSIGAMNLGHADAPLGWAVFQLGGKLTAPGPVTIWQVTPIGPGPTTDLPVNPLPYPANQALPPPDFDGPVNGCEDIIKIRSVIDGSSVAIHLSTGELYTLGAPFDHGSVHLPKELVYDAMNPQTVTLAQTMPLCERKGLPGGPATVGPPDVEAPFVVGLCKGNSRITVGGLNPKAKVIGRVFLNGAEFQTFTVHGESVHTCEFEPPLDSGVVYATQEICHKGGPQSPDQPIDEHPVISQKPTMLAPLYSCQRSIRVKDVHVGAQVQAFAKSHVTNKVSAISARITFFAPVGDIDVAPVLKQGDEVWATADGCGSQQDSNHEQVQAHPAIAAPKIAEPVKNTDTNVRVVGLIPTASVFVYVSEKKEPISFRLAGFKKSADGQSDYVGVDKPLKTGWMVAAAQYYCEIITPLGPVVTVVKQEPLQPNIVSPAIGQKNVSLTPSFSWSDPGIGTERAADTFDITILHGAQTITAKTGITGTTFTPSGTTFNVGTTYNWTVLGRNTTGPSPQASASFTTVAPKPILPNYDQSMLLLKGSNFPPNATFTLRYRYEMTGTVMFGDLALTNDNRQGQVKGSWMSDSSGNINQLIDLTMTTDSYQFLVPEPNGSVTKFLLGPLKGETVHLQAEYTTPNAGTIQSNDLTFAWTKDFVLQN
jgi:hypothetical protein